MNLDDTEYFAKVLHLEVPRAETYAQYKKSDPTEKKDVAKRERVRQEALGTELVLPLVQPLWWAFRITVRKDGTLDVDNTAKLIIDALCEWQIKRDKIYYPDLTYTELWLFPEDNLDYVRFVQATGCRSDHDSTKI